MSRDNFSNQPVRRRQLCFHDASYFKRYCQPNLSTILLTPSLILHFTMKTLYKATLLFLQIYGMLFWANVHLLKKAALLEVDKAKQLLNGIPSVTHKPTFTKTSFPTVHCPTFFQQSKQVNLGFKIQIRAWILPATSGSLPRSHNLTLRFTTKFLIQSDGTL
jgi:hypothetical protein